MPVIIHPGESYGLLENFCAVTVKPEFHETLAYWKVATGNIAVQDKNGIIATSPEYLCTKGNGGRLHASGEGC